MSCRLDSLVLAVNAQRKELRGLCLGCGEHCLASSPEAPAVRKAQAVAHLARGSFLDNPSALGVEDSSLTVPRCPQTSRCGPTRPLPDAREFLSCPGLSPGLCRKVDCFHTFWEQSPLHRTAPAAFLPLSEASPTGPVEVWGACIYYALESFRICRF